MHEILIVFCGFFSPFFPPPLPTQTLIVLMEKIYDSSNWENQKLMASTYNQGLDVNCMHFLTYRVTIRSDYRSLESASWPLQYIQSWLQLHFKGVWSNCYQQRDVWEPNVTCIALPNQLSLRESHAPHSAPRDLLPQSEPLQGDKIRHGKRVGRYLYLCSGGETVTAGICCTF